LEEIKKMKIDLSKEHVKFLKVFLDARLCELIALRADEVNNAHIRDVDFRNVWLNNVLETIKTLEKILKKLER
jgi:hypothetical protein